MVDYVPLRPNNWKLPAAEAALDEYEQAVPEPVVVDVVYNAHEERNGKTIAIKVSFRLPIFPVSSQQS
jgi:hypothetical protein